MGITAKFSGSQGGNLGYEVFIGTVSQDIAANTSRVRVWGTVSTNAYAYFEQPSATLTVEINGGGAIEHPAINIGRSSKVTFFSREYTIPHNPDGTKTVRYRLALDTGFDIYGYASVTANYKLNDIPRASSVSAKDTEIGSAMPISITRKVDSFKHTVRYSLAGQSGEIASNVDTSTSWTIPMDIVSRLPTSASTSGTIYVDTYLGGTKIGTSLAGFTATVPQSVKPTLETVTLSDINPIGSKLVPESDRYIQIVSNIAVDFTSASGAYGSTITGYRAEIVGKSNSTSANQGTLGLMDYSGEVTIRASVVDSRGRWSDNKDIKITILEYNPPALSFDVTRTGTNARTFTINRNAKISSLTVNGNQRNEMKLAFKVAPVNSTDFVADNGQASGVWLSLSEFINSQANLAGTYAENKTWQVVGTLSDKFVQTQFSQIVGTESVILSYSKSGVGVNKVRERGVIDALGDVYIDGHIYGDDDQPLGNHAFTETTNLDNALTAGLFYFGESATGQPASKTDSGILKVLTADGLILQECLYGSGLRFKRQKVASGGFGTWTELSDYSSSQTTVHMPWGIKATATRVGRTVTLSINRGIYNIANAYENAIMGEYLPIGYRPSSTVHMPIIANSGNTVAGTSIFSLGQDGSIRLTGNITGLKVWTGTVTYVTSD